MAICVSSDLLAAATASGFSALSEKQLDVVVVALLQQWGGDASTANALLYAARGFGGLDTKQLEMVQAQLLCDING